MPYTVTSKVMSLTEALSSRAGRDWTLFLDRDGVVNRRNPDGYIRTWGEFEYLPDALGALVSLSSAVPRMVILTNQQGVGKGIMSAMEVELIHRHLADDIAAGGGSIDAIKMCPHLASERCSCRKPEPGMALQWLAEHPETDASLSVMVGDSPTDIEMLHRLVEHTGGGMAVGIGPEVLDYADLTFRSLRQFADAVTEQVL